MIADILQDLEGGERALSVTGKRTRSRSTTPSLRTASNSSYWNAEEHSQYHRQEVASMPKRNYRGHNKDDVVLQVEHKNDTNECYEVEYSHLGRIHEELERIDSGGTDATERTGTTRKILSRRCSLDELEDIDLNVPKISNELECIDEEAQSRKRIQLSATNNRNGRSVVPASVNDSTFGQPNKEENLQQKKNRQYPAKDGTSGLIAGIGPNYARPNGHDARDIERSHEDLRTEREISCIESKRTKRIAILFLLYALAASATCGWLVHQFLRIPGLTNEIDDLKAQVKMLSGEVDRFTSEVDRFEDKVDELEGINDDLELTVAAISDENLRTKDLVQQFNQTVDDYKKQIILLTEENQRYYEYTNTLNQTVKSLSKELVEVRESEANLKVAVEGYATIQENLEEEIFTLTSHANELNVTIDSLNEALESFQEENSRFKELNEDLGEIVFFLEDEAQGVEKSYEELAAHLADTILRKRVLAEIGLHERMKSERAGWQCGYKTAFSSQDFIKDEEVPIGYSSYDIVLGYIAASFFDDLCISRGNFETFLRHEVLLGGQKLWEITSKDLTAGVNMYTTEVLEFYFPDEGEDGVNKTAWDDADYDCNNIPPENRFFYTTN